MQSLIHLKQSGRWPTVAWSYAVLGIGPKEDIIGGWVILLSYPYTVLGAGVCFYLTRRGSRHREKGRQQALPA